MVDEQLNNAVEDEYVMPADLNEKISKSTASIRLDRRRRIEDLEEERRFKLSVDFDLV